MRSRLAPQLGNVHIDAEEPSYQLTFGDDDLLWGHLVVVDFNDEDEPTDIEIVG